MRTLKTFDALVLIDIQKDYLPGGRWELPGAEAARAKAAMLLAAFREAGRSVVHVRHVSAPDAPFFRPDTEGTEFAPGLEPLPGEVVVTKHKPNAFRDTDLEARLRAADASHLLVVGMMSNMCIDASARAAADLGFTVTVAHDACAAMPLSFDGVAVPAPQVHAAFMAALAFAYATVIETGQLLDA